MATAQWFYSKIKEGEGKFNLSATKVYVTSSTWKIFPRVKNSGSTHFPFCTLGIILFSRVFFFLLSSSLLSHFLYFYWMYLLCVWKYVPVPVYISKQLTIISSLLSTEIIRIELNPPGLKVRPLPFELSNQPEISRRKLLFVYLMHYWWCLILFCCLQNGLISSCLTLICLSVCCLKLLV